MSEESQEFDKQLKEERENYFESLGNEE